ncbi:MAG: NAD(P)/FAD-dependent oxidoreductase [Desulfobacterales bacterium]|nr:NAD(P)/FAD-dependent oxidoreductase [Desulfobacterales bacterium]
MRKKVLIIGAGIAGLSAGCYLQKNGYDTQIFEIHNLPGGLCTSWKRKDFVIDGCIHWLVGSSPSDNLYNLWNELVDMSQIKFVDHDSFIEFRDKNGKSINVYCDINKLETELLEKAPEDKKLILEFTGAVRKFLKIALPIDKAPELYGFIDLVLLLFKLLPYIMDLRKWSGISAVDFASKCKNNFLKKVFTNMFWPDMSVLFLIFTLVWMHKKSAGYPIGGSLNFSKLIEKKYLELGGKINYKSKITKIHTNYNMADGITIKNGQNHKADIIISAADGYSTIFEMLDSKYINSEIKNYYKNYDVFHSYLQVSFGVNRTFENLNQMISFPLDKAIYIDSETSCEDLSVRIFNFDDTLAPPGKTVLSLMITTPDYEYWDNLRKQDREKYNAEKQRIADEIIDALDKEFGNIRTNIEMIDVSTPATVIRYTNNWKGSFEGWVLTPKIGLTKMKKVLPNLKNFYMIGQWVEPGGGLPPALMSGRSVAQIICKEDEKVFKS